MQAIFEWQTIAGQEPGNVDAHLALARAYLKVGDRVRALGEYDRVLTLAPGQVEAREFVAKGKAKP
jgi:Tfp pilus assembly protein PilF